MKDQTKKQFASLFESRKKIPLEEVLFNCHFESATLLDTRLKEWKWTEYFHIKPSWVIRTDVPTRWEQTKKVLKKIGKSALTSGIPIAISMATGGAGLGLVLGPVVGEIVSKFQNRGLKISSSTQGVLEEVLVGKSENAIDSLCEHLCQDNQNNTSEGDSTGSINDLLSKTIKLALNEDVQSQIVEIREVVKTLANEKDGMEDIFDAWMEDQREFNRQNQNQQNVQIQLTDSVLDQLDTVIRPGIVQIQESLELVHTDLRGIQTRMDRMDTILEHMFTQVCHQSLTQFSIDQLWQISRIQFQKIRLSGKWDEPYDPSLFVETPSLINKYTDFLTQHGYLHPVFLMLANIGLGKTWNAVYLAQYGRDQLKQVIPFFVPIHQGYEQILQEIFSFQGSRMAMDIIHTCIEIFHRTGRRVLLVFDGLDEYPVEDRSAFLNFVEQLLRNANQSVLILFTDRITDWCQNYHLQSFYKVITPYLYSTNESEIQVQRYNLPTQISFLLEQFDSIQLHQALCKYGLLPNLLPIQLFTLAHRPYILRLLVKWGQYPDPTNAQDFLPFFYNPRSADSTILGRMGIVYPIDQYFFHIVETFLTATAVKNNRDLAEITNNGKDSRWLIILCSGILIETINGFIREYHFDPVFHSIITYYLQTISIKTTDNGTNPSLSANISPNGNGIQSVNSNDSPQQKKYLYLIQLAEKLVEQNRISDALVKLREAQPFCDELYNPELTLQLEERIHGLEIRNMTQQLPSNQKNGSNQNQSNTSTEQGLLTKFHGTLVYSNEYSVLQELESLIKATIPILSAVDKSNTGVKIDNYHVKTLSLFEKRLIQLPSSISALSFLTALYLENNLLNSLPDSIGDLESLEILDLNHNHITSIPINIGNLQKLVYLDLRQNNLSVIPISIQNLVSLTTLYLGSNQLTSIPESIGYLSSLRILSLERNQLQMLPETLWQLVNLTKLNLSKNLLTYISDRIGNLMSLEELNLNSNKITQISLYLGNLSRLKELNLASNRLVEIPISFVNLKDLRMVDLRFNSFSALNSRIILWLDQLKLSKCQIYR